MTRDSSCSAHLTAVGRVLLTSLILSLRYKLITIDLLLKLITNKTLSNNLIKTNPLLKVLINEAYNVTG